jgi:hypothetical protein
VPVGGTPLDARDEMGSRLLISIILVLLSGYTSAVWGRTAYSGKNEPGHARAAGDPAYAIVTHDVGKIRMSVTNKGVFGDGFASLTGITDFFTGQLVPALEYPKGSNSKYIFAGCFWIGAVVGHDTLVSVGADGWSYQQEFNPDPPPLGNMQYRSIIDPDQPEYVGAVSEQDFLCVYYDTCHNCPGGGDLDYLDGRLHQPINIQVTQASYAWSYEYAEDFVLFDYGIKNIGPRRLTGVYMGMYVDAEVHHRALVGSIGWEDDVSGFRRSVTAHYLPAQCPDSEVINVAWLADNDGDLNTPIPSGQVPHVTGMRIVRTPSDSLDISFNWWISNGNPELDFGPQARASYRDFNTGGQGTPEGDRSKYHVLSNREFDYDQVFTSSITAIDEVWMPPNPQVAADLADGYDTRYLLSFGPFDIEPGQELPISFAYLAGENFHRDPNNLANLPGDPGAYYRNLDFSDLGINATWAEWLYDNPGVDTDSDGYAGVAYSCTLTPGVIEKVWRRGDGVPDFKGASPPPAPIKRIIPRLKGDVGSVVVRWNGTYSETTKDNFLGEVDFEGYRVYLARDDRASSYTLLTSYDFENYNKWVWTDDSSFTGWDVKEIPFGLDTLRALYSGGDSTWHPLDYPRNNPFWFTRGGEDSIVYFESQDFNQSELGVSTPIKKFFHDDEMIQPTPEWLDDTTTIPPEKRDSVLTEDGLFKFYEYIYEIDSLLPTVPYWVNVTAFDFGSPQSNLTSLETSITVGAVITYATTSALETAESDELNVYVYPNPYRLDADYRGAGFEGRGLDERDRPDDRVRRIHFANLPATCRISIYTLDGDLVREINHDVPVSDPMANHDSWDLITRNTQLVVSGLYYWTVESSDGRTQVGKLAIIM